MAGGLGILGNCCCFVLSFEWDVSSLIINMNLNVVLFITLLDYHRKHVIFQGICHGSVETDREASKLEVCNIFVSWPYKISVGESMHTNWLGEPGCGPRAECCTPLL